MMPGDLKTKPWQRSKWGPTLTDRLPMIKIMAKSTCTHLANLKIRKVSPHRLSGGCAIRDGIGPNLPFLG